MIYMLLPVNFCTTFRRFSLMAFAAICHTLCVVFIRYNVVIIHSVPHRDQSESWLALIPRNLMNTARTSRVSSMAVGR